MKLFALFAASAMAVREIPIGSATECWNCNAQNLADCAANGFMETCRPTQENNGQIFSSSSCSTTIRQREGNVYFVSMGCKDTESCVKQWECNFMHGDDAPEANDCQPGSTDARYGSVCNQCCPGTQCTGNPDFGPFSFDENTSADAWAEQLVTETQELN